MKEVTLAAEAGFCFGVNRAVEAVNDLTREGKRVCTLGAIIHNPQVVSQLAEAGVCIINSPAEAPEGYQVVIRSHGVPKEVYEVLEAKQTPYTDMTCPYVQKIQRIVAEHSAQGTMVLIAGDEHHPEIQGIISHCRRAYACFRTPEELEKITKDYPDSSTGAFILIAQTTFSTKKWELCTDLAKSTYTNLQIFGTICKATILRQEAAENLAMRSDVVIVVGGKNSSNTAKLAEICGKYCPAVLIESPEELSRYNFSEYNRIGVTAGASTPAFIIKEVQRIMSDKVNYDEEMSFEEMLDESFKTINARDKVTGVVTSVSQNEIAVDIGTKHAGYVPLYEYTDEPNINLEELVKVGDEIELMVLRLNDAEGTALLSKKRLDAMEGFEKILEAEAKGETLKGAVIEAVKGGIIALSNNVRVFIPASHATIPRGQDLNTLIGEEIEFKLLETNRNRRRAVGSIREVLLVEREKQAGEFWETAEVGQILDGVVKSLTSYGAFIDLGGVDGMAHISELSWTRIKHPSDIVEVGQEVRVTIKELDRDAKKISLTYKQENSNPWTILERDYQPGQVVPVKIVSMTSFGAFAEVIPGVDGLIHISQISNERIEKPADVLSIGKEVEAAITDIDFERKRVSLSIRALLDDEEEKEQEKEEALINENEPAIVAQFGPEDADRIAEEGRRAAEAVTEEVVEEVVETIEETKVVEEVVETIEETEVVEEVVETIEETEVVEEVVETIEETKVVEEVVETIEETKE